MKAHEFKEVTKWQQTRRIEYSMYATAYTMEGKPLFRVKTPLDLYKLPGDPKKKDVVLKGTRGDNY